MRVPLVRHFMLLIGAGALSGAPAQALAQDARGAVEAQYERLANAIRKNVVGEILAFQAPTFSSLNMNGSAFDYAAMERYTRQLAAAIDSVLHVRNVIRTFEQSGDTAVADVCQEFSRIQRIGDGQPHRVETSALQRETWVRLAGEWKRTRVENVRGTRWFVDGVRVDSSRPYTDGMPPTNRKSTRLPVVAFAEARAPLRRDSRMEWLAESGATPAAPRTRRR